MMFVHLTNELDSLRRYSQSTHVPKVHSIPTCSEVHNTNSLVQKITVNQIAAFIKFELKDDVFAILRI